MIQLLRLPFGLPRMRSLALAGIAAPTMLTADFAAANPTLSGAVILSALLVFGTFVLSRWKLLALTAPVWIVLLAQADPADLRPVTADPQSIAAEPDLRPTARPWG